MGRRYFPIDELAPLTTIVFFTVYHSHLLRTKKNIAVIAKHVTGELEAQT